MGMNPLRKSFFDTIQIIRKNKLMFIGLIIIQLIFLVSIFFVAVTYQIKIYSDLNNVITPLQSANLNATALEAGQPFLPDMSQNLALMIKSYNQMISSIFEMLFLILGCFLLFNGCLWSVINFMVKSKSSNPLNTLKLISNNWKNFIAVSLVFIVPAGLISYYVLINLIFDSQLLNSGIQTIEVILLVIFYFLLVGFSSLDLKLKNIFKKIFWVGFGQAHWVLLSLLIILGLVLLSLMLIYYGSNSLFLMTLGAILTILVLLLGKLFLVGVVKGMNQTK